MTRWLLTVSVLTAMSTTSLAADIQLTHSGRLLDALGTPVQSGTSVTVRLYDAVDADVADALWEDTYSPNIQDGYYTLLLGADTPALSDSLFDGSPRYIGISTSVGGESTPRQLLTSVPYAAHATNVGGGEVRLSDTTAPCTDANRGALKYDGSVWVCTEVDWSPVRGSSGAGDPALATGGIVSDYTVGDVTYRVHTFAASGSLTVTEGGTADVLVVGGGGSGGGDLGGGGGAGGVVYVEGYTLQPQIYSVTVGAGGAQTGTVRYGSALGNDGSHSSFATLVAQGGGAGGAYWGGASQQNGRSGGSGGGGAGGNASATGVGGPPSAGGDQGSAGGGSVGGNPHIGGGGGGAGGPGTSATSTTPGQGGPGRTIAITGTPITYGGGGGGSHYGTSGNGTYGGAGGTGGGGVGGYGASNQTNATGKPGLANTGGGGGGGAYASVPGAGGAGGSGVVIVRYPLD